VKVLLAKKGVKMRVAINKVYKVRHEINPLVQPRSIVLKERTVKVGSARELVDTETGEVSNVNAIYQRKVVDSERFAKVYIEGLAKTFGLSKTAQRVFKVVLAVCGKDTDSIFLNFMIVSKEDPSFPESTFYRGLQELLENEFLAYSDIPNKFWINPHLFFNGNRVKFITEYVKDTAITGYPKMDEPPMLNTISPIFK
jgi:phage shock protein PspC (stress-responsive transcriptional regulator)